MRCIRWRGESVPARDARGNGAATSTRPMPSPIDGRLLARVGPSILLALLALVAAAFIPPALAAQRTWSGPRGRRELDHARKLVGGVAPVPTCSTIWCSHPGPPAHEQQRLPPARASARSRSRQRLHAQRQRGHDCHRPGHHGQLCDRHRAPSISRLRGPRTTIYVINAAPRWCSGAVSTTWSQFAQARHGHRRTPGARHRRLTAGSSTRGS